MKNVLKKAVYAVVIAALVSFVTGCPKTPDPAPGSDVIQKVDYKLSVDTEAVDLIIGEEAKVVTVTTNGTYNVEVEAETVATAAAEGDKITITPVAKGTTTVIVTCNEDATKTAEIAVTVTANTMVLTLKLGDDIAIPGGSIVVKYGNGGDTDKAAYEYYVDAEAVVSEDGKTATVELDKAKANEWGWFNGLIITVKDAEGNEIDVEYPTYFEYNADGEELTISKKIASTKTISLVFEDFEADAVKVTYGYDENKTTVDAVVAEDGKSATVEISSEYKNATGWLEVSKIEVTKAGETVEVTFTGDNTWFDFGAETVSLSYKLMVEENWKELKRIEGYGGTGNLECVLGAGDVKDITAVKVDYANMSGSGDWWMQVSYSSEAWDVCKGSWNGEISGYTATTENAEVVAQIKENGLYFVAGSGLVGDLIIYCK